MKSEQQQLEKFLEAYMSLDGWEKTQVDYVMIKMFLRDGKLLTAAAIFFKCILPRYSHQVITLLLALILAALVMAALTRGW